ncbi:MAG: hypothetical protein JXK05_13340 [Campylobacterales bacterium]|nr:hypothetical protein [Campylobacterales bacterium]
MKRLERRERGGYYAWGEDARMVASLSQQHRARIVAMTRDGLEPDHAAKITLLELGGEVIR